MAAPQLNPALLADALSFATTHSMLMLATPAPQLSLTHAPFTLFPSALPRRAVDEAAELAPRLNRLVCLLAEDAEFLEEVLASTAASDSEFTGRLLEIYRRTRDVAQKKPTLAILRSDYFVAGGQIKQVEINTIAASFGCLGAQTARMHRHLASAYPSFQPENGEMPQNEVPKHLAGAIATALRVAPLQDTALPRKVLFVVQGGERNKFDQDFLRFTLREEHQIDSVRMTLAEVHAHAQPAGPLEDLVIDGFDGLGRFVAPVAYFRAGYGPDDFSANAGEWAARELIERSTCVPCPSVGVQLVGAKKIQQVLDRPGIVERYFGKEDADQIRRCFVRQWSLSAKEDGRATIQRAIDSPEDFVLKPQREGGGNNLYSDNLKRALESMTPEECEAFVLMERIKPDPVDNTIVRGGVAYPGSVVSELGVFGVYVQEPAAEVPALSKSGGLLLRSKFASVDDGGVAAGVAVLDSPLLVDR